MNGMIKALWAAVAIAIVMVTNILPANAQSRTWRRDGVAPATSEPTAEVSALEKFCKRPENADRPICKRFKPCLDNSCPGGTATPPSATSWGPAQNSCLGVPEAKP